MKSRVLNRAAGLVIAAVIALAIFGCSKKAGIHSLIPNRPPTVEITSAPVDTRDTASYSVHILWSGDDPDGRVDHYEFAIDPSANNTVWHRTTRNDTTFTFTSTEPIAQGKPTDPRRALAPHSFTILAVDNQGMKSEPRTRSFFSYTVAPTVRIMSPKPSDLLARSLTPSMTVTWEGTDPDGYLVNVAKPIYYRYKVFEQGNSEFDFNILKSNPDSLRRYYAKTNFESWSKVGHDTTFVKLNGQTVGHEYVFVVVAFDTAGAYSPVFNLTTNMLWYEVGFAATLGPVITVYNESFYYTMPSGGYTPNDPISWVHLELPAANKTTFNWFADPPSGAAMQSYRWRLDGDVGDETPRTNEATDWYHWSAKLVGTTSCVIGPFRPGILTFLYIEAEDDNGLKSIVTIVLHPVQPTFEHELLVVNDTRPEVDQFSSPGVIMPYTGIWPSTAELDTFLFARGGYPWRGTQVPASAAIQPVSRPGLFAGYSFDTLGTRLGLMIAANGVPLSLLGKYKHIVWMVDPNGGSNSGTPIDAGKPTSTLHWMCTPNHLNTLGSYISSGGSVWLLGGDVAKASLLAYNVRSNDTAYPGFRTVFGNNKGELVPGRLMYDSAHWQDELAVQPVSIAAASIIKSPKVPQHAWTSPGWNYRHPIASPNYALLPATMRKKLLALGDSVPPTRPNTGLGQAQFYGTGSTFDVEYMTQPNYIIEDLDSTAFGVQEASSLDTLMDAKSLSLAATGNEPVSMTYYHGVTTPEIIFSGFDIWKWTRADDITMVDFVLQQIWKMNHNDAARWAPQSSARPGGRVLAKAGPATVPVVAGPRLPSARTAGR